MGTRITVVETLTGEVLRDNIQVASASWKSSITMAGDGTFLIKGYELDESGDPVWTPVLVESVSSGWAPTWVVTTDDEIEYAGPVTGKSISNDTGDVTVRTNELPAILAYRLMFGVNRYRAGLGDYKFTGATIKDVLLRAYHHAFVSGGGTWDLPVDVPSWANGSVTAEYWRDNFQTAEAFVDSLKAESGTPDVFVRPYWSAGKLRWRFEIGSPHLSASRIEAPIATPFHQVHSPVVGLVTETDFKAQRTGIFATGEGSEVDMLVAVAGQEIPGIPAVDGVVAYKNISQRSRLQGVAEAALSAARNGTRQRNFNLQLDDGYLVRPRVGSQVVLRHPGSPIEAAWTRTQYVLAVSSTLGGSLYSLETQEI